MITAIAACNPADATDPARLNSASSPALARSWRGLCGVGHPGFIPFPAPVAPTIPMTVPRAITSAPVEPVTVSAPLQHLFQLD
jgi:hypothetical protein